MKSKVKKYYDRTEWENEFGQLHRLDGPAIEYKNGDKEWYQNGKFHRLDGPAAEYKNGYKYWIQNNQYHRLDGPAVEGLNGHTEYWIYGKEYLSLFLQFEEIIKKIKKYDD